jgi:beta-glucosidase
MSNCRTARPTPCPQLVKSGRIPQFEVDAAVSRVLTMKFEGGFFENPYCDEKTADAKTATPDAVALAREAARKAVVLLKNDKGLLPLDGKFKRLACWAPTPRTPRSAAIPTCRATWSRSTKAWPRRPRPRASRSTTPRPCGSPRSRIWAADEVKLIDPAVNAKLIAEAVEVAKKADVVVMVLGDNEQTSREAWADNHLGDRDSLDLIGQQNDLAKAIFDLGKPTVVFLLNGRPLSINLLAERADAIIEGWYLGEQTGNAAADILFGRANPGGKLPVSIARDVGQLPIYYNRKPTARRGYLFGETTAAVPVRLRPFVHQLRHLGPAPGQGHDRPGRERQGRVDVTNTGKVAGDEVVQLYIHDEAASVTRPVLELKHFKRVTLAAGAKTTVTFEIKPSDLWFWNLDMKRVVEPGMKETRFMAPRKHFLLTHSGRAGRASTPLS